MTKKTSETTPEVKTEEVKKVVKKKKTTKQPKPLMVIMSDGQLVPYAEFLDNQMNGK